MSAWSRTPMSHGRRWMAVLAIAIAADFRVGVATLYAAPDAFTGSLGPIAGDESDESHRPVAVNDGVATPLDTPVDIDVLANDRDPDGDALTVTTVGAPVRGTASIAGGVVTYTPPPGFEGTDQFVYSIADPTGLTASAAVMVSVGDTPPPPPPVLTVSPSFLDFGQVPVNKTKDLALTITNDTAAPVALAEVFALSQGAPQPFDTADSSECALVRVLDSGQSCTRRVRFWAVPGADAAGPASARLLDGQTFETLATVPFFATVGPPDNGPNRPPVAVDDLSSLLPGFTQPLEALRNDSDPDDDLLRITAVSDPPHGTATVHACDSFPLNPNEDCIHYLPDAGYVGLDAFVYTVSDGRGGTATATYHLVVGNAVTSIAAIVPGSGPTAGGQAVRISGTNFVYGSSVGLVCGNSIAPLTVTQLTDDEILAVTPPGFPGLCDLRVLSLFGQTSVLPGVYRYSAPGGPPVAHDGSAVTNEGTPVTIALGATDPDGDPLTFAIVVGAGHGTLSAFLGNQVTYTPQAGFSGPDSFTFKANDGQTDSNVASVVITVTPISVPRPTPVLTVMKAGSGRGAVNISPVGALGTDLLDAGSAGICAIGIDQSLTCWGGGSGQAAPPTGAFIAVTIGALHACGLRADRTVQCWGNGVYGQTAAPPGTFTSVSAGADHNCAIGTDGTVACWGSNSYGQTDAPAGTFSAVAAGGFHTCAIHTDGTLACWGSNVAGLATPPAGTFFAVAAGDNHTCAIRTDGTLACWGFAESVNATTPPAGTFSALSVGSSYTCAIRTDGTLACWGYNNVGQATPPAGTFSTVAAGAGSSCAIRTDGAIVCWGDGTHGQTSPPSDAFPVACPTCWAYPAGAQVTLTATPEASSTFDSWSGDCTGSGDCHVTMDQDRSVSASFTRSFVPVIVRGSQRYASSVAVFTHAEDPPAGVTVAGTLHCATVDGGTPISAGLAAGSHPIDAGSCTGLSLAGSVGGLSITYVGSVFAVLPPTLSVTKVGSGHGAVDLSPVGALGTGLLAGGAFGICAIGVDESVTCWGGGSGQAAPPAGAFSAVTVGALHACGLRPDRTVECWGSNVYGQAAAPAGTFTSVSAGADHNCAIGTDGTVACWGWNGYGQTDAPAGTFSAVAAGGFHTCAIHTDGTLACWGSNLAGRSTPPAGTFSAVAAGDDHTCAIRSDGTLACWGADNGVGATIPPVGTFSTLSVGGGHTCAVRTDGTLACWGYNAGEQNTAPAGTFSTVAAAHSCAIRNDGAMVCWGDSGNGQTNAPADVFPVACPTCWAYPAGTAVTLTATPESDSAFGGWSGDCTGAGACTLTMDRDRAVTARFTASADLSIAVSAAPATILAGRTVRYTVTVTNSGPSPANGVGITMPVRGGYTLGTVDSPGGPCVIPLFGVGSVFCSVNAPIPAGGHYVMTVDVVPTVTAALTNTFSVSGDVSDPTPANNQASVTLPTALLADLAVTAAPSRTVLSVGDTLTYTVSMTNRGPNPAPTARLTIALPPGLQYVSSNTPGFVCSSFLSLLACDTTNVAAGASRTVTIVARVAATGPVTATFAAFSPLTDPDATNNTAAVTVDASPTVTINQAASQGDPTLTSPILFTVAFSEPVTGFDFHDISFAGSTVGGTLFATVNGSGANYTVAVTGMTGSGTVAVSIPAGAARDTGGNASAASTSTDRTVLYGVSLAYGFLTPSNGGTVAFSVVNTGGPLTGVLTYTHGSVSFLATRFTSFVISGQDATLQGFASNGKFFRATLHDGGAGQPDTFRLWIDGIEQTAGGTLTAGSLVVQPWTADTRLKGWVDLHTHPMSNIAFGGKLFHGAPSVGSLMPAVQMPSDPQCRFDNRATSIAEALSQDGPTHADPIQSRCGDFVRHTLIQAIELFNGAIVPPDHALGYPAFGQWPNWADITHQKMWIDWVRRAWDGGLRVMVALSHNNRTLAELLGGGGPITGVRNDKDSSDLQVDEIARLVADNSDFMAVARTPAELQAIVQGGRLAVVLGVEIDKIGDFTEGPALTQAMIDAEVGRLFAQGVRYILPVHFTDNAFGDAALYQSLFDIVNYRENNRFFSVGCAQEADEVGFRFAGLPPVLAPFIPPGAPAPPVAPSCLVSKPAGPLFVGHVNTRSPNGLTALGEFAVKAMMRRGIMVDIDHMSNRAANRALALAAAVPGGGYPVMSGHTGVRDRSSSNLSAENSRTTAQLARIACLGGMFGMGTDGARAYAWAGVYTRGYDAMRRAFGPGGLCPQGYPLGDGFVGLGTDTNSLVKTPTPSWFDPVGPQRMTDIYNPNNPINAGVPPLSRSTTGSRTWDYNFDGVAHYGMFVDFLRDVRTWTPVGVPTSGREIFDDEMMYGAEYFYRSWLKADAQKSRVP